MVVKETLGLGYRIIIFLVTFGIVVYLLIASKIWSGDLNIYFIRTGRWGELIFVALVVYIISQVLERLLRWEFRLQTRGKRR